VTAHAKSATNVGAGVRGIVANPVNGAYVLGVFRAPRAMSVLLAQQDGA
jgi:hypothetical protein